MAFVCCCYIFLFFKKRFGSRVVIIEDKAVNLQVWDTAGQETFRSIGRSYYRGAAAALLVYDVTNRDSFVHLGDWVREIHEHGSPETVTILVGNKIDLEDQRDVSTEEGKRFAKENGFIFIETSAKTAENVEDAFIQTARAVFAKIRCGMVDPRSFPGIKFSPQEMSKWEAFESSSSSSSSSNGGGGGSKGMGESISLSGDAKKSGSGFSCC